jgi:hypothetical protein
MFSACYATISACVCWKFDCSMAGVSLWVISRTIAEAVQLAELVEVLPWSEVHFETTRIMQTLAAN